MLHFNGYIFNYFMNQVGDSNLYINIKFLKNNLTYSISKKSSNYIKLFIIFNKNE